MKSSVKVLALLSIITFIIIFKLNNVYKPMSAVGEATPPSHPISVNLQNSTTSTDGRERYNGESTVQDAPDVNRASGRDSLSIEEISVPLSYRPPPQSRVTTIGKPMNVSTTLLRRLGIPPTRFKTLTSQNIRDHVFVTAASSNNFNESRDCVAGIQQFFSGRQILYFDIGLTEEQRNEIKDWCDVELRAFAFEDYPPHVSNRYTCAFKPIIIKSVMAEFDGIFWVDSSIRIMHNEWETVYENVMDTNGFYMARNTWIPLFAVTHPDIYKYLPTDLDYQKGYAGAGAAGALILHNTKTTYWNILHWWYLCGLDPACIAPAEQRLCGDWGKCVAAGVGATCWAGCHRYDQSAINIVVANVMRDQRHVYLQPGGENPPITVERRPTNWYTLRHCTEDTSK